MARHNYGGNHWGPWGPGQGSPGPWGPVTRDSNYDLDSWGPSGPRPKPSSWGPSPEPWGASPWNGRPPRY